MIETIARSWSWLGVEPADVVAISDFGNVIFVDSSQRFWRISPEELSCKIIAGTPADYDALIRDEEFCADWQMTVLSEEAKQKYGEQPQGRCFCLKIPAVLGGEYHIDNVGTISVAELIGVAGEIARQIEVLPDGTAIEFEFAD